MSCDNNGFVVNCCCWFTITHWCTPFRTCTKIKSNFHFFLCVLCLFSLVARVCLFVFHRYIIGLGKSGSRGPFNSEILAQSCVIGRVFMRKILSVWIGFACSGNRSQCMIDLDVCNDHSDPFRVHTVWYWHCYLIPLFSKTNRFHFSMRRAILISRLRDGHANWTVH